MYKGLRGIGAVEGKVFSPLPMCCSMISVSIGFIVLVSQRAVKLTDLIIITAKSPT